MTDAPPLLSARGLHAGYEGRDVLRGVDLALRPGDLLGVVGPNGSGKSTLIRALSGALRPSAGEVLLEERSVSAWPAREVARRLAVVPQMSSPAFAFTVHEMVAMGRHPHLSPLAAFSPADRAAVDEAMELTDVAHLARRPVDRISGGELQRTVIARALAQRPAVLLLDEPTAHLDLKHQLEVFALLLRLARDTHLAVLCISHDLNLAAEYCARVALLSEGRIYAEGTATEVITAGNLQSVYGALVRVTENPTSGQPVILVTRAPHPEDA